MPITVACSCGKQLHVRDELAGKKVKCSQCGQGLLVPITEPAATLYYLARGSEKTGPFSRTDLLVNGIRPESLVWREGLAGWIAADQVLELKLLLATPSRLAAPGPPPLPPPVSVPLTAQVGFLRRWRNWLIVGGALFLALVVGLVVWVTIVVPTGRRDRLCAEAKAQAEEGDYTMAEVNYGLALMLDPQHGSAYRGRAQASIALNRYDKAIADCTAAIRLDSKDGLAYALRAVAQLGKGNFDRARIDSEEALRLNPQAAKAYVVRGSLHAGRNEPAKAIADFNEAIRLDPRDHDAYIGRGAVHSDKGDWRAAIADFGEAIRLSPQPHASFYYSRGVAYGNSGDLQRAISDFSEAIRLEPANAIYHHARGYAFAGRGDLDRAIADYSVAIERDPRFALAYLNRGQAYGGKGDLPREKADLDRAIQLDQRLAANRPKEPATGRGPSSAPAQTVNTDEDATISKTTESLRRNPADAEAYDVRGIAYEVKAFSASDDKERNRFFRLALADYGEAIRLRPKNAEYRCHRARMYEALDQPDQAITDCNEAIQLDPKCVPAHVLRASVYLYKKREPARAIVDFTKALQMVPTQGWIWRERGEAHLADGQYDQALRDIDEALRLASRGQTWSEHRVRGRVFLAKGDLDRAIADFDRAIAEFPDYAEAYLDRSVAQEKKGNAAQAKADRDKAILLDPAVAKQ